MLWFSYRRLPGLALVFAVLACSGSPPNPPAGPLPDVLVLIVDCLRGDGLGVAGYERPTSPAIDAIAGEGTVFTRAFAQSSWTRPSLPTLLTGLYPSEHRLLSAPKKWRDKWSTPVLPQEVETVAERMAQVGYATGLFGEQYLLSPRLGLAQGFGTYLHRLGRCRAINRRLLDWVDALEDGPMFAVAHYLDIHWPYCSPERFQGVFDEGSSELDFCSASRALRRAILDGSIELSEADRRAMRARYDEELLALDTDIGRLVEALRARGRWAESLVVVTSDHGEEFFEHGSMGHGSSLFDELIHVPLIIKPPLSWAAPAGQVDAGLVESAQVAATLADAAGMAELRGVSLLPQVRGEAVPGRDFVVSELESMVAVRSDALKLVIRREGGEVALYDLASDPGETVDVAANRAADVERLRGYLRRWRGGLRPVNLGAAVVDKDTIEGLEALGYLD